MLSSIIRTCAPFYLSIIYFFHILIQIPFSFLLFSLHLNTKRKYIFLFIFFSLHFLSYHLLYSHFFYYPNNAFVYLCISHFLVKLKPHRDDKFTFWKSLVNSLTTFMLYDNLCVFLLFFFVDKRCLLHFILVFEFLFKAIVTRIFKLRHCLKN